MLAAQREAGSSRYSIQAAGAVENIKGAQLKEDSLPENDRVVEEAALAARRATSMEELGDRVACLLGSAMPIDRMNIGLLDMDGYVFTDAYVTGSNVPGRKTGHRRPLSGTVVEAGMREGGGIVIGGEPVEALVDRFPRLQSTLDTGIRSMLTVVLEHDGKFSAALVLASTRPSAYTERDMELVRQVGAAIADRIMALR